MRSAGYILASFASVSSALSLSCVRDLRSLHHSAFLDDRTFDSIHCGELAPLHAAEVDVRLALVVDRDVVRRVHARDLRDLAHGALRREVELQRSGSASAPPGGSSAIADPRQSTIGARVATG